MSNGKVLTSAEIALAGEVFQNSITCAQVEIFNERYIWFQPVSSGMTPNGKIYVYGDSNNGNTLTATITD